MNIYEKLLAIQAKLNAPKNQVNKFGGYNYRNCEDVLEALKPLLKENNATLVITDDVELIGDRYYVIANAVLFDTEKPENKIAVRAYAREVEDKKGMDLAQITRSNFKLCTQICFKSDYLLSMIIRMQIQWIITKTRKKILKQKLKLLKCIQLKQNHHKKVKLQQTK